MQSVPRAPRAFAAHKHDRHFANPSVGWANFPPEKAVGGIAVGSIKQLPALISNADDIWRAVPCGTARLTAFISVSARHLRTPMNSPLRSARPEKRPREAGFDEGCSLN
ncbi:hypothetical protein SCB29_29770 [Paraburkholderia sp. SIMBA_055]|jgi:hypothetical protein|uniref:Uncharacterized protein n=2 Tax=Paraburkholderia graminis TaxID=60548 RepID=B1G7E7_PARG4|nr:MULTISPECIES: hypothetical protein [Paraburkholderia]AXF09167.1 hypothetical protein CUJ91_15525 [Paraburkholderia graminis]EDT07907.1 hypothetical protein BgramDRAFT_5281 [Paraburkholderia graminis C4D1M]MDQ0624446.1 hypothetical protein [Paraburkholderia graminis]MDR6202597.1 hypothetical protein [Paraburkholderia graminis]MDR6468138.1 hypothetical protein [Paraburkholderia graminis]